MDETHEYPSVEINDDPVGSLMLQALFGITGVVIDPRILSQAVTNPPPDMQSVAAHKARSPKPAGETTD